MILNMKARDASVSISNISLQINANTIELQPNFFITLQKEVKSNPNQSKKLTKLMSTTGTMLAAVLFTAPQKEIVLDPEIQHTMLLIMGIVVLLAIGSAVIAGMLAGIWKMFFGARQADEWTYSIIKGFTQVLVTPVIIASIVGLFMLLFHGLPAFKPVEEAISTWFHN